METSTKYLSYINDMQNYKISDNRKQYQAPFKENFEDIYQKAQNSNINLSNAKEFLHSLTNSKLSTVKNFSSLADKIDIDSLSDEGAYNLLMHDY